jgi:hypothetical protein
MSMSAQRSGQSSRHREEEDQTDAPDQAKKPKPDNRDSAITERYSTISTALNAELGFDEDTEVDHDEIEKRTRELVEGYVQKPGQ